MKWKREWNVLITVMLKMISQWRNQSAYVWTRATDRLFFQDGWHGVRPYHQLTMQEAIHFTLNMGKESPITASPILSTTLYLNCLPLALYFSYDPAKSITTASPIRSTTLRLNCLSSIFVHKITYIVMSYFNAESHQPGINEYIVLY